MQFLAYYCATDMLQWEVINGNEKSSDINKISQYNKEARIRLIKMETDTAVGSIISHDSKAQLHDALFPFKDNFVFLDHSNGDYYCYKPLDFDIFSSNQDLTESSSKISILFLLNR